MRDPDLITPPAGQELGGTQHETRYNQIEFCFSLLMVQTAIEGLGIDITQPEFVEDDLASGRLVTPFDEIFSPGKTLLGLSGLDAPDRTA